MKCSFFSHTVENDPQFTSLTSYGPICSIDTILNRAGSFWPTGEEDPGETGLVVSIVSSIFGNTGINLTEESRRPISVCSKTVLKEVNWLYRQFEKFQFTGRTDEWTVGVDKDWIANDTMEKYIVVEVTTVREVQRAFTVTCLIKQHLLREIVFLKEIQGPSHDSNGLQCCHTSTRSRI